MTTVVMTTAIFGALRTLMHLAMALFRNTLSCQFQFLLSEINIIVNTASRLLLRNYTCPLLLHCALSLAAQCIVIGPVCGCVCVCVCVFVCGLLPR